MKNTRFNSATKMLAVILAILMALSLFPVIAIAEDEKPVDVPAADADKTNQGLAFEVTDRREETVKHFRLSDGTYAAVQYSTPVHNLDADGMWQDIDNTLSEVGEEFSTPNARVKFAKKVTGNETLLTLHDGNAKIAMSLNGAKKKTKGAVTNTNTVFDENATELQKLMTLDKLSSRILYENILNGVDLEYVVEANDIKENIIVKERAESYSYTFTISLNNLSAELTEDGSVNLYDTETMETVYVIPKGYMVDAEGEYSDSVSYTLVNKENGCYEMTIASDVTWMNATNRAFPVTIDPSVTVPSDDVIDLTIYSSAVNSGNETGTKMYVGNSSRSYWKTTSLINVPDYSYITEATISLYTNSTAGNYIGAYQVTTDWSSNLTWNKTIDAANPQGVLSTHTLDYQYINGQGDIIDCYSWNVTSLVRGWYNDTPNYGIGFKIVDGTNSSTTTAFFTNNYNAISQRPQLIISYRDMKGLESYWSTVSQNAGLAGNGYVKCATGNLVLEIGTIGTGDSVFGFTPTLYYDTALASKYFNANYNNHTNYRMATAGYGLKWNFSQTIVADTYTDFNGITQTMYIWIDSDGTEHYFTEDDGSYKDEDGLGLTLEITQNEYLLESTAHTLYHFTKYQNSNYVYEGGILSSISDIYGNQLLFDLNIYGHPTCVKLLPSGWEAENALTYLTFTYNSLWMLYRITNNMTGQSVTLEYGSSFADNANISVTNAGPLRRVKYGHSSNGSIITDAVMEYSYTNQISGANNNSTYRLSLVKDTLSGYEIQYSYVRNNVVGSVHEFFVDAGTTDTTPGQSIDFYFGSGYTRIRTAGTDDILQSGPDGDDLLTTYVFDNYGRTVSTYTNSANGVDLYGAVNGEYADTNSNAKNSISSSVSVSNTAINLLYNGDFEFNAGSDPLGWNVTGNMSRYVETNVNGSDGYKYRVNTTANSSLTISQTVSIYPGTYTLSLNTEGRDIEDTVVELSAQYASNDSVIDSKKYTTFEELTTLSNQLMSLTFKFDGHPSQPVLVNIIITVRCGSAADGRILFDKVMLQNGCGVGDYNLLQFGGFENSYSPNYQHSRSTEWNTSDAIAYLYSNGVSGSGLMVIGSIAQGRYVSQTIPIHAYGGEKTYILSGMGKIGTVLNSQAVFAVEAEVFYTDTTSDTFVIRFSNDVADWQFAAASFTTDEDKTVDSIVIKCCLSDCLNYVYFDNICLVEDSGSNAVSYKYNDPGLLEYEETSKSCIYREYDEHNNLIKIMHSDGYGYSYSYWNDTTLKSSIYFTFDATSNNLKHLYHGCQNINDVLCQAELQIKYKTNGYGMVEEAFSCRVTGMVDESITVESLALKSSTSYYTDTGSYLFGRITQETDTNGYTKLYHYDSTGLLISVTDSNYSGIYYTYDSLRRQIAVRPAGYLASFGFYQAGGVEQVTYDYNDDWSIDQIHTASTTYSYTYDEFGNVKTVSVGNNILVTKTYAPNNGKLLSETYGNDITFNYTYDALDRVSEICYTVNGNEEKYIYEYTSDGNIHFVESTENLRRYVYDYDTSGRCIGIYEFTGTKDNQGNVTYRSLSEVNQMYDDKGRCDYLQVSFLYSTSTGHEYSDAISYEYVYGHDSDSGKEVLTGLNIDCSGVNHDLTLSYHYDDFLRFDGKSMVDSDGFNLEIEYEYKTTNAQMTNLIQSYSSTVGNTETKYTYGYDNAGNITSVSVGNVQVLSYAYDDLGQLIRENNSYLGKTYVYTYDNAGNILCKETYALTAAGITPSGTHTTVNYGYNDPEWGDLLTSYNGQNISYDEIGNPDFYNGYTLEWEGRRLTRISMNGGQFVYEFAYNADGIRTMKRSSGTQHVYALNGTQILTETIGNKLLVYLYDESGAPIGMQYRTTSYAAGQYDTYFFEKNLQGDIIAVYTENGTKVGSYVYDAWGNCSYTYATGASPIQKQIVSTYNPFRYRGYYLDVETGLYYLQTRYYDPAVGRFLSADCYVNANGDLIGFNMYAYCSNNPIKYKDSIGYAIEVCFGLDDRIPGTVGISIGGIAIASTNEKANKLIGKYCSADSLEETIDNGIDFVTGMNPGLYLLRVLHYRRNKFNKVVPPIPDYLLDESESKLHQNNLINGNPNLKYVDDGFGGFFASETVYYSNGKINMTPEDQGTFNVYYGDCWMGKIFIHGTFDVIPYILWGNSPDDSTEIWDRFG